MFVSTGTIIDSKFEVRYTIGAGGMGVVYDAFQPGIERDVALKVLTYAPADDPGERERFKREAIILSRLAHPNIVQFHAYGIWCGFPYIAMEKLAGLSLAKLLAENENGIAPKRALQIAVQICRALQHAHTQGIFHRDIKPTNVILVKASDTDSEYSQVKLIDFGLAKLTGVDGQQKLTQTGQALGSVMYMSPEQCQGQPVDARTDIYAVGCLLYQCLVGEAPFLAETGVAVMFHHINEPIEKAHGWYRLSRPVQSIIAKCMAKQPKDRYGNAGELLAELEQFLASPEALVSPPDGARQERIAPRAMPFGTGQKRSAGRSLLYLFLAFLTGTLIILALHLFDVHTNHSTAGGDSEPPVDNSEEASLQRITSADIAYTRGALALHQWEYPKALRFLKRANDLLVADPSKVSLRTALLIKVDYVHALHHMKEYETATPVLLEAEPIAKKLTGQDQSRVYVILCMNSRILNKKADALKYALEAVRLLEQSNKQYPESDVSRREGIHALSELAIVYEKMGKLKEAETAKRKSLQLARNQTHVDTTLNALYSLASNLFTQHRFDEAAALMKEWQSINDNIGKTEHNPITEARSQGFDLLGRLKEIQGDMVGAEKHHIAALDTGSKLVGPFKQETIGKRMLSLAYLYYRTDRIEKGDKMSMGALMHLKAANYSAMDETRDALITAQKAAFDRVKMKQATSPTH